MIISNNSFHFLWVTNELQHFLEKRWLTFYSSGSYFLFRTDICRSPQKCDTLGKWQSYIVGFFVKSSETEMFGINSFWLQSWEKLMDIPYLIFFSRRACLWVTLIHFLLLVCYRNILGAQNNRVTLRTDISRFRCRDNGEPFSFLPSWFVLLSLTLGLAELATMCNPSKSCALVEDSGISTAYTIAHELGHV